MPKRAVSIRLKYHNHRLYRLRTRREIKTYINAMIASGKTTRKGTRKILSGIRSHQDYWNDERHCMAVYFMAKRTSIPLPKQKLDDMYQNMTYKYDADEEVELPPNPVEKWIAGG